jgi:hypothetical protein
VPTESLKASWLVYGHGFVQGPVRTAVKRAFDILCSATLLALASPVMLVTALLIKLDSPGPVIYRQERVGLGGRGFMCLKFRSMGADAERDGVARWATKNDARVTRVGAFIRKCRIDELPQLISVLKGEMSLVGPRPERPSFVEQLRGQIPFYDIRHSVKPGVRRRCAPQARVRPVLRQEQLAVPGPAGARRDGQRRPVPRRCAVRSELRHRERISAEYGRIAAMSCVLRLALTRLFARVCH